MFHICSAQPTSFANVASVTLGNKSSPSIGSPTDATSGRKVVLSQITGGSITADGTASHYAVVDGSRLLVANALSAGQVVTNGNTFSTTGAIDLANFTDPT